MSSKKPDQSAEKFDQTMTRVAETLYETLSTSTPHRIDAGNRPLDLNTLVALAERKAIEEADGHLTIFRFTTGWKIMGETPDVQSGRIPGTPFSEAYNELRMLDTYQTIEEALVAFLVNA